MSTKKASLKDMREAVISLLASQRGVSVDDSSTITMVNNMTEENLKMFYENYCGANEATGREIIERVKTVAAEVKAARETREAGRARGRSKRGETEQKTELEMAQELVDSWGKPLVYSGCSFWEHDPEYGWLNCDLEVDFQAMVMAGTKKNGIASCAAALVNLQRGQRGDEVHANYGYNSETKTWAPLKLGSNQVLFCNGLLTIRAKFQTEDTAPVRGNGAYMFEPFEQTGLIFGLMITIPFTPPLLKEVATVFTERVENALHDADDRDYLQKLCGLILQPHIIKRAQYVFNGVPHSGKTTFATAVGCAPAGIAGCSFMTEADIVREKYGSAGLHMKFANISDDSEKTKKYEPFIKNMNGGKMVVRRMNKEPETVFPTATMISTNNELQHTIDFSGAMAQRYRLFIFTHPLPETGDYSDTKYMDARYWADPQRRSTVLNWMLVGLFKSITEGLEKPASMIARVEEAISEQDPIRDFIRTRIVKTGNPEDVLKFSDIASVLQTRFREFPPYKALARLMELHHGATTDRRQKNGVRVSAYFGYKIE